MFLFSLKQVIAEQLAARDDAANDVSLERLDSLSSRKFDVGDRLATDGPPDNEFSAAFFRLGLLGPRLEFSSLCRQEKKRKPF